MMFLFSNNKLKRKKKLVFHISRVYFILFLAFKITCISTTTTAKNTNTTEKLNAAITSQEYRNYSHQNRTEK